MSKWLVCLHGHEVVLSGERSGTLTAVVCPTCGSLTDLPDAMRKSTFDGALAPTIVPGVSIARNRSASISTQASNWPSTRRPSANTRNHNSPAAKPACNSAGPTQNNKSRSNPTRPGVGKSRQRRLIRARASTYDANASSRQRRTLITSNRLPTNSICRACFVPFSVTSLRWSRISIQRSTGDTKRNRGQATSVGA